MGGLEAQTMKKYKTIIADPPCENYRRKHGRIPHQVRRTPVETHVHDYHRRFGEEEP